MSSSKLLALACLAGAVAACGADGDDDAPPAMTGGGGGTAGAPAKNPLGRERCQAPAGVSASPSNTQEAIALLNALPKPTSVACFVESLARPLGVQITNSIFSAQPALSAQSPRVFIKMGAGWLSIVIDGDPSYLVEFGEVVGTDPTQSVKGELRLPLQGPVAPSAAYDRVQFGVASTTCGLCHYNEQHADNLPFASAYGSIAFQPRADSLVSVESLRGESQRCDWQAEAHRCEMLSALFDGGSVVELPFPSTLPTFF